MQGFELSFLFPIHEGKLHEQWSSGTSTVGVSLSLTLSLFPPLSLSTSFPPSQPLSFPQFSFCLIQVIIGEKKWLSEAVDWSWRYWTPLITLVTMKEEKETGSGFQKFCLKFCLNFFSCVSKWIYLYICPPLLFSFVSLLISQ